MTRRAPRRLLVTCYVMSSSCDCARKWIRIILFDNGVDIFSLQILGRHFCVDTDSGTKPVQRVSLHMCVSTFGWVSGVVLVGL